VENVIWNYAVPLDGAVDVTGYVAFYWDRVDAWFEEDEEVFVHVRDPYKRVDCLSSSRKVSVVVNGETIAETDSSVMLFETGMPRRFYIPKSDVRAGALRPSEKITRCPYKGEAHYYSIEVGGELAEDLAWSYRYPIAESGKIAGHLCFPQGKVDLFVDGVLEPKPQTRWD
jgi:uncharacterized protein (DUF427 family)